MKNLCFILEKSQAVVVVISTVFINPDIYWAIIIKGGALIWPELLQSSHRKHFQVAVTYLADFLDILCQYMSEFMKTVSTL